MYALLLNTIYGFIELQNEDISLIKSFFRERFVKKDTVLIDRGDVSDIVFFINTGFLRYYNISKAGEEQTIHLSSPGEFAASFSSFVSGTRSDEVLHAISDAELLFITRSNLEKFFESGMKWQRFGRKLMETLLLEKEKRIINQISMTAQERYIRLMETKPVIVQNVPIQYIASYIGIKPESLSRIRKQIFLTNVK